ncbi:MAG: hypothetical protein HOK60_01360 [Planctomycetes bacterium]|nr:hypothetical protein [Planctomycetota bacterium]MBT6540380.1 hypothetical protein [Planctomycetota bacterium]MBT6784916.1 hypothetical protein [Planctomycetota bacterium]MBT6968895.1 hypothetical protein [Planctomycetota bacterium]MBT7639420.1 hypothetical protein [Planctomycetota bacterium]
MMEPGSDEGGRGGRNFLLAMVLLTVFGLFLVLAKEDVDRGLERAGGVWAIEESSLPGWFPRPYEGSISSLAQIPSKVSLQSVRWKSQVVEELERNPWINSVQEVIRTPAGIGFTGQFVRPSVGIRSQNGWLLIDGTGRVIDRQPGDYLADDWKIPEYLPQGGSQQQKMLAEASSGDRLSGSEFEELLALLSVLWEDQVFDRVPGFLHELSSHFVDGDQRLWYLHTTAGIRLHWGRSPAYPGAKVATSQQKLECLRQVIELRGDLARSVDIEGISLYSGSEPITVKGQ